MTVCTCTYTDDCGVQKKMYLTPEVKAFVMYSRSILASKRSSLESVQVLNHWVVIAGPYISILRMLVIIVGLPMA